MNLSRRIAEQAKKTPKGEWIKGGDWDETKWSPAKLPTKDLIDGVTPDNPVFLSRYDGHSALANSQALRLAGITSQTPNPPGGAIVRDEQGDPTGDLKDAAMDLVFKVIPPLTHEQRLRAVRRALEYAGSLGVTSVQHMNPDYADIAVYAELLQSDELTTRIYAAPLINQVDDQVKIGIRHAFGGPYLRIGAVKAFADGSLGSRTAYFFEPYSDERGNQGLLGEGMQPLSLMRDRMMNADAAGLQICTHAIGDQAISMVLDLYTDVVRAHHGMERRLRIEHAQHMAREGFRALRAVGRNCVGAALSGHRRWALGRELHRPRPRQPDLRVSHISQSRRASCLRHRLGCCAAESSSDDLCCCHSLDAGREKSERLVPGTET